MAIAFDATLGTITDTASLTTSAAAAAGSRVFVFAWANELEVVCTGMSAGGGLTWVVDHQYRVAFDDSTCIAILSADAPSGLASSTVLTPSWSSTPIDFGPGIAAHSWTGVQTGASGYVDTTAAGLQDFNETWATNNLTTTAANTLLFGFSEGDAGTSNTAATDYTERHDWAVEGGHRAAVVSRVVSSAATYNPGGTWSTSVSYQMNIGIAYKEGGVVEVPANVAAREFYAPRIGPF